MVPYQSRSFERPSNIGAETHEPIDPAKTAMTLQGSTENLLRLQRTNQYATTADVCRCFSDNLENFHRLAFLLTRDAETAQQCFVAGLEDCVKANNAFREWARSWAKRAIIQTAIRRLQPQLKDARASESTKAPYGGTQVGIDRVLTLDDFERFVFVMSVLVHYSDRDCALLLGCSLLEIRKARLRAFQQIVVSCRSSAACEIIEALRETK